VSHATRINKRRTKKKGGGDGFNVNTTCHLSHGRKYTTNEFSGLGKCTNSKPEKSAEFNSVHAIRALIRDYYVRTLPEKDSQAFAVMLDESTWHSLTITFEQIEGFSRKLVAYEHHTNTCQSTLKFLITHIHLVIFIYFFLFIHP